MITSTGQDPGKNPIELDRTGIDWELDFEAARAHAKEQRRLLMILADNYQPTDDGTFGFEAFRLRYFCDARVRGLLDRRFVACYFNTFEHTAAHDAAALEFVVRESQRSARASRPSTAGSRCCSSRRPASWWRS